MKQLKKTILTLALLIAATTQAWAGDTYKIVTTMTFNSWPPNTPIVKEAAASLPYTKKLIDWVETGENNAESIRNINVTGENIAKGTDTGWNTEITVNGAGTGNISFDLQSNSYSVTVTVTKNPTATPIPVAWDADTKTGTIAAMPSGNVTVNVDYYPQATAGNGAVTAATSAQAQTDSPLVTVDNAKLTGASALKFCVTTTNSAPGYDDTGWTTNVPTAKDFNADGGTAFVWYYPVGNDDTDPTKIYSDGDMCATALEVTVAAAPTYDVSLNKTGLATGEPANWKAKSETVTTEVNLGTNDLEGVKKGETVTVTYTGTRKVIGVKAQKTGPLYMKWDDSQKALVPTEIPATVTKVEDAEHVTWPAGTYLVEGDVGINGYIELTGDVELIIKDGAKLTAKEIYGEDIYSLSVYGQTNMSGELNLACSFDDAINCMTALNIHSCKVNASSSEDNNGGFFNILEVNVYGGLVNAEYTGSSNGFGIGSDVMNIYGGEVKAIGKGNDNDYSYGINNSNGTTVNVYGGKLWAECSGNRAINSNVTLTKGEGFNGKIETCSDGTSWTVYTETGTPDAKYVRVGY